MSKPVLTDAHVVMSVNPEYVPGIIEQFWIDLQPTVEQVAQKYAVDPALLASILQERFKLMEVDGVTTLGRHVRVSEENHYVPKPIDMFAHFMAQPHPAEYMRRYMRLVINSIARDLRSQDTVRRSLLPAPKPSGEDASFTSARREEVRLALMSLPEQDRLVVVLLAVHGKSQEDVSDLLCLSRKQVQTIFYAAKAALQLKLATA